ncbi:MAG: TonB C-terminal domain-containing protein [Candidatus Obscuribacterales bacterium]|nr:TonB C-terminal domain-containing protein [Candidatus Obscuribacterales bacterium]
MRIKSAFLLLMVVCSVTLIPADAEPSRSLNPEIKAYVLKVKEIIQKRWEPPKGYENKHIIATFSIRKNGEVANLVLKVPSGIPAADEAALKAINESAPFAALPASAPGDARIVFSFDYKELEGKGEHTTANQ